MVVHTLCLQTTIVGGCRQQNPFKQIKMYVKTKDMKSRRQIRQTRSFNQNLIQASESGIYQVVMPPTIATFCHRTCFRIMSSEKGRIFEISFPNNLDRSFKPINHCHWTRDIYSFALNELKVFLLNTSSSNFSSLIHEESN